MLIESLDDGDTSHCAPLPAEEPDVTAYSQVGILVGAGARLFFYPTLLCNLVRNKLESEFRWWDEIEQFLFLGAVPFPKDIVRLKTLGVEAVVTLNESYETLVSSSFYESHGIKNLVISTRDYIFAPSFDQIQRAVDFIYENIEQRKAVYVHCKAGRARSTTIVLCYLVKYRGMSPVNAFGYVRAKRPRVSLAASQWKAVLRFSQYQQSQRNPNVKALPPVDQQWPLCKSPQLYSDGEVTKMRRESISWCGELPIFIMPSDLEGYQELSDAICASSKVRSNLGLVCKVGIVTAKSVIGFAKASVTLARLSYIWLGYQQAENQSFNMTVTCGAAMAHINSPPSVGHSLVAVSVC